MQISNSKALHLANYLGKGALVEKNREISIQIGEKSEIGISKRGRKYAIIVKYAGKYDRTAHVDMFDEKISIEELAASIKKSIEKSVALANVELDMRKVPMITNPVEEQQQESFFSSAEQELDAVDNNVEDDLSDFAGMFDENENPETAENEANWSAPEEIEEEPDEPEPEVPDVPAEEEELPELPEEEASVIDDQPDFDDFDADEEYYRSEEDMAVDMDEEISADPDEESKDENRDKINETIDKNLNILLNREHLLPSRPIVSIAENSYLYQLIGDEEEIKEKMARICEQLADMDRELITSFYISALSSLLVLYENDIERLSNDIQIDKRDIMLALYERKFL